MYRTVLRRRLREVFDRINEGDWRAVGDVLEEDVRHVSFGHHALSGERHSRAAFEAWLRRTMRLFPGLRFEVRRIPMSGPPWNTWAAIHWTDHAVLVDGSPYENFGITMINVRWRRVVEVLEYMDTETVAAACRQIAAAGIDEALAPPLLHEAEVADLESPVA